MTQEDYSQSSKKIPQWIIEDLAKSGLTLEEFSILPLESESQLKNYLGYTNFANIRIIDVSGYWILYPNVPRYYRLKLREKIGDAKYLSPGGKGSHAYILPQVAGIAKDFKPDKAIFFTEGEKKSCKATLIGLPTIGLSGVWNFKDKETDFLPELDELSLKYRKCYIVFDSDIIYKFHVRHAELRLAIELINRGAVPFSIRLPDEKNGEKNGLDDFLVRHGGEFEKLINKAKPTIELHLEEDSPIGLLTKEVARISSLIQREQLIKLIASHKKISKWIVEKEIEKHLPKENKEKEIFLESFTGEEIDKARNLLNSSNIIEQMLDLSERYGYVGESTNKQMLYLSFSSRLMNDSVSCIIKGESSSGKSSLVHTMLGFFPKEDVLKFSFITPKALIHFPSDISHKILFLQERQGAEAGDYSIRTVLSEKELSILATIKDELSGAFRSEEKKIKADGLVYIETTTKERIHNENQTRLFDLFIDESKAQTVKILQAEAEEIDKEEIEKELRIWRALQKELTSYQVIIPFSKDLADAFPTEKVRARRDFKRFLSLIRVHALLHQFQREKDSKNRIVATIDDLKAILPLAGCSTIAKLKGIIAKTRASLKSS